MSDLENSSAADAVEQEGNPTPENGGSSDERKFTQSDVDRMIKDRLAREQKRTKQVDAVKKTSGPDDSDLKNQVTQSKTTIDVLSKRVEKFRQDQVKTLVEKTLVEAGCNDPELMSNYFLSRSQVRFDDDDNLIVEGADSLDELVKNELAKRPHLQKPKQQGGLGMKAPAINATATPTNLKNMTSEQFAAWKEQIGAGPKKSPF